MTKRFKKPKRFRESLLSEARILRNLGTFFSKYQDELDDRADNLEEEALERVKGKENR